jgi:hypothetical protein
VESNAGESAVDLGGDADANGHLARCWLPNMVLTGSGERRWGPTGAEAADAEDPDAGRGDDLEDSVGGGGSRVGSPLLEHG